MSIPLYLAMTAADFSSPLPERAAWMAVHFSVADRGISNVPASLPPGSLVILNDQIPWNGHSSGLICSGMVDLLLKTGAEGLLLDFERPALPETRELVRSLALCCEAIGCPVAMPPAYLSRVPSAVFLPPLPCRVAPELPENREVWAELSPTALRAVIGAEGTALEEADPWSVLREAERHPVFREPELGCMYFSRARGTEVEINLFDTRETLMEKLCRYPQITRAVGSYREWGSW